MHTEGAAVALGGVIAGGRPMIFDLDNHAAPFVTVAELAAYWGVSTAKIYRDIDKGAVPDVRRLPGGVLRIPTRAAREYGRPNE